MAHRNSVEDLLLSLEQGFLSFSSLVPSSSMSKPAPLAFDRTRPARHVSACRTAILNDLAISRQRGWSPPTALLRAGPRSSRARRKDPYLWSVPFHLAYADLPSPYQSSQANKSHFERAVRKLELKIKDVSEATLTLPRGCSCSTLTTYICSSPCI